MTAGRRLERRTLFAAAYMFAAGAFVVALATISPFPGVISFLLFAIPAVWIDLHSVEVNDKLRASSGAMVLLSAGIWFGPESAPIGLACLAGLWPFVPADFRERRVFFPVVNLAQTLVAGGVAGLVLRWVLLATEDFDIVLLSSAAAGVVAALAFTFVTLVQLRFIVRFALLETRLAPWTDMGQLFLWEAGLGVIGATLGATLVEVGIVLLPVFFVIYLIGQLAFQSYADLRQAQESTIQGFIKTLEAKDMFVHGHTARVASFVRMIGEELQFSPERFEQMRWAALLHDVGAVAVPRDLLRNRRSLTDEEQEQLLANAENVERELHQSDFLRPMMERAARVRVNYSEAPQDEITADAQVLAVAKWFDSVTSTRVLGQAMSQEKALAQMRAESPYRYDPDVVEAFARALEASGFQYGAVDFDSSKTREDYAKEAMYDR